MKKTYIKPETTVVALNVCNNLLVESIVDINNDDAFPQEAVPEAREVIRSRGAWEEW